MKLKPCDCCGGPLASPTGSDVFFVARLQITKATAWNAGERDRALKAAETARRFGDARLADALDAVEPATIIGDKVPHLITHADLRICPACVQTGRVLNLTELIHAAEVGPRDVPSPETT